MNDIPLIEPTLLPATIPSPLKTKECRFVTYVPSPEWEMPDLHVVKEVLHFEDGTTKPNLNFIYDYKRPTWVTKKGGRNHKQHKEWEYLDNLIEVPTTQTRMIQNLSRALGMPGFNAHLRKLFEVPYIYGADIKSTAVLKKAYMDKYPGIQTKFSVASFDIETSMFDAEGTIIMASVSFKDKVFSVVREDIVEGHVGWRAKVDRIIQEKFSTMVINDKTVNLIEARNLKFEIDTAKTELDILQLVFAKFHEWQPDFLEIWNMDFEMTKIIQVCERFQYDPKYLFSDPSVPDEYKYFNYKQGPSQKRTSSGKFMPIKPAARWHTVFTPASFYIVDGMCAFKHTRAGEQEEQSYSLDSILRKLFNMGKMTFKGIPEHIDQENHTADWHRYMQKNKPLEYLVYNQFDCVGPELIDEKVMDLAVLLQKFSGTSDFEDFKSQPRRVVDKLHWFGLERGKVIGVTSAKLVDEFDEETLDREDWVITLPAALVADNGIAIFEDNPFLRSSIRAHIGDLDVSASYPNGSVCYNISKETTSRELMSIDGIDEEVFRAQNMGLSAGHVNAIEYCTTMMNYPDMEQLLHAFEQKNNVIPTEGLPGPSLANTMLALDPTFPSTGI